MVAGSLLGSSLFLTRKLIIRKLDSPEFKTDRFAQIGLYQINRLPPPILKKISYGLVTISPNGLPQASPIVEKYTISPDEKTYTFTLKRGVFWHNGKELDAKDINLEIPYTSSRIIDDLNFQLQLQSPFSPIMSILSQPLLKNDTIGLGDYKIENYTYQDGYLKSLALSNPSHQQNNLTYVFYPSAKDAILGFKLGEIDTIPNLTSQNDIPNWPNTKISSQINTSSYVAIFFNTAKFGDKKTRQALAYATPKNYAKKDRAISPIDPNSWVYTNQVKEYNFDPTHAQELFKGSKLNSIQLQVNDRELLSIASDIKSSWEKTLRLKVEIVTRTQTNLEDFDVLLALSEIPLDPDQYSFWHSTQTNTNLTKLSSPRIDKLLEDARQINNPQARKIFYTEFQKALLEESPAIFLFYPTQYSITRIKS